MTSDQTPADEGGNDTQEASQSKETTLGNIAGKAQTVQAAIESVEDDVPTEVFRRLTHMKTAIKAIQDWAKDADPHDTDAVVGASTIVDAERTRAGDIRQEVPDGNTTLLQKFDTLENRLEDLANAVDARKFSTTQYVVYVNKQFVKRYADRSVTVETILVDAGKKDPDELGLFPLDGLLGNRQEDQAFPAERDLNLSDDYRTFFESTSDGGKIAHE
ncbi:hypothetical protein [Halobacterium noricense]|uniref:hypothetical protein n=1 Tax=Halobacterium noricense TaxID=223182 RepID=UPI001E535530|nr:hypothetical protein [Halobacterium noricense]UHH25675.1 hypothetical protein LT974_01775 [Halobacterium noricense]